MLQLSWASFLFCVVLFAALVLAKKTSGIQTEGLLSMNKLSQRLLKSFHNLTHKVMDMAKATIDMDQCKLDKDHHPWECQANTITELKDSSQIPMCDIKI